MQHRKIGPYQLNNISCNLNLWKILTMYSHCLSNTMGEKFYLLSIATVFCFSLSFSYLLVQTPFHNWFSSKFSLKLNMPYFYIMKSRIFNWWQKKECKYLEIKVTLSTLSFSYNDSTQSLLAMPECLFCARHSFKWVAGIS